MASLHPVGLLPCSSIGTCCSTAHLTAHHAVPCHVIYITSRHITSCIPVCSALSWGALTELLVPAGSPPEQRQRTAGDSHGISQEIRWDCSIVLLLLLQLSLISVASSEFILSRGDDNGWEGCVFPNTVLPACLTVFLLNISLCVSSGQKHKNWKRRYIVVELG